MKKGLSILLIVVVLLSSLHFTVATHLCGGKRAAIKAGLEGTTATCGMEKDNSKSCSNHNTGVLANDCCKNSSVVLSVDNYNGSSPLQLQKVTLAILQVFLVPVLHTFQLSSLNPVILKNEGLSQSLVSLSGRLAFICVFRI